MAFVIVGLIYAVTLIAGEGLIRRKGQRPSLLYPAAVFAGVALFILTVIIVHNTR